jgi:tetratricopeptide (TPR) repeat protein
LFYSCNQKHKKDNNDLLENEQIIPEIKDLNKQIEENPNIDSLYYKRALVYMKNKLIYDALNDINKSLQLSPENTKYMITLADIYFSMKHIDNCRETLIKAQDNDPENTEPILKLAELNLILKDYDKMHLYLNKAIDIDKTNSEVYFMRGVGFKETGDTINALKNFHIATSLNSEFYKAFVEAGILCVEINDPLAIEYLNTAINLNPESIEARYPLALFFQENNYIDKAIQEYYTITSIESTYYPAYYNLGYIYLVVVEDYKKAIAFFDEAIRYNVEYTEAYYNRGLAYEKLGDFENARKDYKKALSIYTNYDKAIKALNRIEKK